MLGKAECVLTSSVTLALVYKSLTYLLTYLPILKMFFLCCFQTAEAVPQITPFTLRHIYFARPR